MVPYAEALGDLPSGGLHMGQSGQYEDDEPELDVAVTVWEPSIVSLDDDDGLVG